MWQYRPYGNPDEKTLSDLNAKVDSASAALYSLSDSDLWQQFRLVPPQEESPYWLRTFGTLIHKVAALSVLVERAIERVGEQSLTAEKWLKKAETTTPINVNDTQQQIASFYEFHHVKPPAQFLWFDSPAAATHAASMLHQIHDNKMIPAVRLSSSLSLHEDLLHICQPYLIRNADYYSVFRHGMARARDRMDNARLSDIETCFRNSLALQRWIFDEMMAAVRMRIGRGSPAGLYDREDNSYDDETMDEFEPVIAVRQKLMQALPAEFSNRLSNTASHPVSFTTTERQAMHGDLDQVWLSMLRWVESAVPCPEASSWLRSMDIDAGYWWAFPDFCVVSKRPVTFKKNTANTPHSLKGKAIEFADGFGVYAWNGIRVSDNIAGNRELSVQDIVDCPDSGQQLAMIDRYGRERFLDDSYDERDRREVEKQQVLAEAPDPFVYEYRLWDKFKGDYRACFLKLKKGQVIQGQRTIRVPPWAQQEKITEAIEWATENCEDSDYGLFEHNVYASTPIYRPVRTVT